MRFQVLQAGLPCHKRQCAAIVVCAVAVGAVRQAVLAVLKNAGIVAHAQDGDFDFLEVFRAALRQ